MLRKSSRSDARISASDQLFLKPSLLTLLVTGGRRIPKTSSGSQPTTSSPVCSAIVPRKLPPILLKRKFRVFNYPYSILRVCPLLLKLTSFSFFRWSSAKTDSRDCCGCGQEKGGSFQEGQCCRAQSAEQTPPPRG